MLMYPDWRKTAVVGATADGIEEALNVLALRRAPVEKMRVLVPPELAGMEIRFGGHVFTAEAILHDVLNRVDLVYFSRDDIVAAEYEPVFIRAGAGVVHIASMMFLEAA